MSRKRGTQIDRVNYGWYLIPLMFILFAFFARDAPILKNAKTSVTDVEMSQLELPLHVNEHVERWIELFQTVLKSDFEAFLSLSLIHI